MVYEADLWLPVSAGSRLAPELADDALEHHDRRIFHVEGRLRADLGDDVAGLSVGAFAAAVAAGTLSFPDALALVKLRGEAMAQAVPRGHGMIASGPLSKSTGSSGSQMVCANPRGSVSNPQPSTCTWVPGGMKNRMVW